MAFQDGKLMRITVGGKEIFHEVSVSLSGGTEFKDVATKDTSGTESTPGSKSWTASVEGVASADSTTEHDFLFFINGQDMEHDALAIQQAGASFYLQVDTDSIGYELEGDDEILAWGKFNS